ncbi:hypothetical protein FH972_017134 [Carpinus fangiana]|uniref:Uncharacterized protein n=1 Tax=Carpinus fangiana TaxID=176857 RepID=A0A5N6RLV4_9ROSI|nr:hypothetical protein FH972_017134 [Carpinus fangiana]
MSQMKNQPLSRCNITRQRCQLPATSQGRGVNYPDVAWLALKECELEGSLKLRMSQMKNQPFSC